MMFTMLSRRAARGFAAMLAGPAIVAIAACGSKGDLVLPTAAGGPPPAQSTRQPSTIVPIAPAIPSPPPIPPETAPNTTAPKQP